MSKIGRSLVRTALGTVAAASVLALAAPAAHAGNHYRHGNDYAYVYNGGHSVKLCDRENDGNKVYARLILDNGANEYGIFDSYGGGCRYLTTNDYTITNVHLSEF